MVMIRLSRYIATWLIVAIAAVAVEFIRFTDIVFNDATPLLTYV